MKKTTNLKSIAFTTTLFIGITTGAHAVGVVVAIEPEAVVSNGGSYSVNFGAISDVTDPIVAISNNNNEGSWSVRVQTSASNGVFLSTEIGADSNDVRQYILGESINLSDVTLFSFAAKELWSDGSYGIDTWNSSNGYSGFVGLSLGGSLGNYAAWIEVAVNPSGNGRPVIRSYGYESAPNTNGQIQSVPEPSTTLLFSLISGGLCFRRRR